MAEPKTLLTAEDLAKLPEDGWFYELHRGELVKMPPAGEGHGPIGTNAFVVLHDFVRPRNLGLVSGFDHGFRLARDPDTVRAPDVWFIRRERLPAGGPPRGYWEMAPDLAVEVVSGSERERDMRAKLDDYMAAGTRLVWFLFPRTRRVRVHRADGSTAELGPEDTLDGGDVLPGFSCRVEELFAAW